MRSGQHAMAQRVSETLALGDLGEHPTPTQAIAIIQAGTGVGKSAAYSSTAIALALERKTRVLISTATVALQEQLMRKDLPAVAASMAQPFIYALAKGRSRYVCKLKLERLAGSSGMQEHSENDFFETEYAATQRNSEAQAATEERRMQLYEHMAQLLASAHWDGDRDSLANTPQASDWALVAAERNTCTARHCPRFKDCSYYAARMRLSEAQVIVANHDLVLASLGMKTLPDLDNCLIVFDEGHHLPAVALDQFSSAMDLSNLRWLDKLPRTMQEISGKMGLHLGQDIQTITSQLKGVLTQLARQGLDMVWAHTGKDASGGGKDGTLRFANGQLPPALEAPITQIHTQAVGLSESLEALGREVKALSKDDPSQATQCAQWYAQLGALAPRLQSLLGTSELLLEHGPQPLAKWLQVESGNGYLTVTAHASPIVPGDLLKQFLWSRVRAAVITSASLTSCGTFDYFLNEAGLDHHANVSTLEVSSPFDYANQGVLTVVHTQADPKNADAYTQEMVQELIQDLHAVERGALVLFTSRAQMQWAVSQLPRTLTERVWVQGTQSRPRLLAAHAARIESGQASILFGLQSFGEGLDLPGSLCETVCICKLPFSPPSDPIDEARTEWLRSVGRDPFNELVVPATGIKLLQWTGRAIRTENDRAHIICYDKRLTQQNYGRRMLAGLPAYTQKHRSAQSM